MVVDSRLSAAHNSSYRPHTQEHLPVIAVQTIQPIQSSWQMQSSAFARTEARLVPKESLYFQLFGITHAQKNDACNVLGIVLALMTKMCIHNATSSYAVGDEPSSLLFFAAS